MLIPDQFVQRFGNCSHMVAERHLDGHSPLGFAMTVVIVLVGDCFLLSLRVQRSNPVASRGRAENVNVENVLSEWYDAYCLVTAGIYVTAGYIGSQDKVLRI